MRVISGFFTVGAGFFVMMIGIMSGFTIIGLLWAFPVAFFGWGLMLKGFADMGMGSYEAVKAHAERQKQRQQG
ncbi:hypothetical protein [Aliiroseovarius sp.]|uniref:hypothetical protein n=1 Tax=Aliiroseovarius sp. TaxID=1872442 RepID=UPI003BA9893D